MDPRLDFARELEQRDAEAAERLEVLARLAREVDRIRGRAEELRAAAVELASAAAAAARELGEAPRVRLTAEPGEEPADVLEWAARAHAAILVARSGLESERDRIFREANELGSSVLGEPLQSTNVTLVRRRVEERLGERT